VKQVARVVFWVLVTLAAVALLWAFRGAVVLLLLSVAMSGAVQTLIDDLHRRGVPFRLALAIAYGACLGVVGLLVYILAARLAVEVPTAADRLVESYGHHFERAIREFRAAPMAQRALGGTMALIDLLGSALLVIAMSIYWTGDRDAIERLWLSFLPVERRRGARSIWTETRRAVGAVLWRELGQSVVAALALSLGLWLAGCDLWALATLALLVLRLIPLVGPALAVAAVALAALPSGVMQAILAPLIAIAVLAFLRAVVALRWFRIPRPIDPILAVPVMLAMAGAFGLAGLLASPLVSAAIQTACAEAASLRASEERPPRIDELAERLARVERGLRRPSPTVSSLLARLHQLVERAAVR
jgi:predicted PurR-regulated permease PerM